MSSTVNCPKCFNTNVLPGSHCGNCGEYIVKINLDKETNLDEITNEELLKDNLKKFLENPNSDILEIYKFGNFIQIVRISSNEILIGVSKSKHLNSEQKLKLINLNFTEESVNHFVKLYSTSFQQIENEFYNLVLEIIKNVFNINNDVKFKYDLSILSTPSENSIIPEHRRLSKNTKNINLPFKSNYLIFGIILLGFIFILYSINKSENRDNKVYNFSLDSSVYQVEKYLKNNLHDRKSYEPIEWSKVELLNNKEYMVRHKYRANNEFGVKVIMNQIFFLDINGNVIHVQDYNQ